MHSINIEKIDDNRWLIPRTGRMNTEGLVYASDELMKKIKGDESIQQVSNVACLPGIVGKSMAMPDIHSGYGFPIGGVAAFDIDNGIISPGGVGYDINCGVRLYRTDIDAEEIKKQINALTDELFKNIPSGVGSKRKDLKLSSKELKKVLTDGAVWALKSGFGSISELECIEDSGAIKGADPDPDTVSDKALQRGMPQLGTLGSGNHFVEIALVEEVFDTEIAKSLGLYKGLIAVTIHTGSRGFGYQVCDDYIKNMLKAAQKYGFDLPDRQLCCAPVSSPEGRRYFSAMACAANYAFANRQIIGHWVRETFENVLDIPVNRQGFGLVYDVCHNIAKIEEHTVDGIKRQLCVHRKGATRAFPPGHSELPLKYRKSGQPVLIPGDMGTCSYVLTGAAKAMDETFGSTCHGAGRMLSRNQAIKKAKGRSILREIQDRGIYARAAGRTTLVEEMPEAYKNVSSVVNAVCDAGICIKVVRLKPLGVIKG